MWVVNSFKLENVIDCFSLFIWSGTILKSSKFYAQIAKSTVYLAPNNIFLSKLLIYICLLQNVIKFWRPSKDLGRRDVALFLNILTTIRHNSINDYFKSPISYPVIRYGQTIAVKKVIKSSNSFFRQKNKTFMG